MPIANDPLDPARLRDTLGRLTRAVAAAVEHEAGLARERGARVVANRREQSRAGETDEARLTARLTELKAAHEQALAQARAAHEARRAWSQRAYHAARGSLAARVQRDKDTRIGRVQSRILHQQRARQKELALAGQHHRELQEQLAADRGERHGLRRDALRALRPFRVWLLPWFDGKRFAETPRADDTTTPGALREESRQHLDAARAALGKARRLPLPRLFRCVPATVLLGIVAAAHAWAALRDGGTWPGILPSLLGCTLGVILLYGVAFARARSAARRIAAALATARAHAVAAETISAAKVARLVEAIRGEEQEHGRGLSETFRESDAEWQQRMREGQRDLDARHARVPARAEALFRRRIERLEQRHLEAIDQARREAAEHARERQARQDASLAEADAKLDAEIAAFAGPWQAGAGQVYQELTDATDASLARFPAWTGDLCAAWSPPAETPRAVRIGRIEADVAALAGGLPHDPRLALPGPARLELPLALAFPDHGSLLLESEGDGGAAAVLQSVVLRLLAAHAPGRVAFTLIDPVGLGRDFAGLMHLADYEESLIHHRIWTQGTQIEERLAELNEHIEKVIQMFLRNEFATITEYNEQAGCIAEKSRFLVIAGFPAAFSETAAKRLLSIAASGPRCGVHLLVHRDLRLPPPLPGIDEELRRTCLRVAAAKDRAAATPWTLAWDAPAATTQAAAALPVVFDPPPPDDAATALVHRIGRASIDSTRVEVPFSHVTPAAHECWTLDTTEELRVPVGRTGAKKLQMLAIGKGTRQHVLVAGKTGSGKSTLFHVIVTNLALWCAPDQVEFYLVDFKKGVEFKCYAAKRLAHARVVAIESDREFALSVLQRVDTELKRRGDLFRQRGAQDLASFKRGGGGTMPRVLLLIDEFQEFFTEDDAVAQEASLLLDRIVRQGRAFGIHVILGSQTLGGAYTLARATLGQMVIRIALQCNEADAHLIMDDDNPAPRLLTRPGEGIYNDQAGSLAANSPFQTVWLDDAERDASLERVAALASERGFTGGGPVVFEGNAPADVGDNDALRAALRGTPAACPDAVRAWLGAPNSIKGPTEAVFRRQSGSHLLVVGQAAERTRTLLGLALLSLAAQQRARDARFLILDSAPAGAPGGDFLARLAAILPHEVRLATPGDLPAACAELAAELAARGAGHRGDAPPWFVVIHDLQRFKALRPEDDFRFSLDADDAGAAAPSRVLADLLGEGGSAGIHVLASIDTWNNVSRWIPRKLLGEFEWRVLFQMSANDSANLIDSPAAAGLGLHRALLHNEHLGTSETFRPYAVPGDEWLAGTACALRARAGGAEV